MTTAAPTCAIFDLEIARTMKHSLSRNGSAPRAWRSPFSKRLECVQFAGPLGARLTAPLRLGADPDHTPPLPFISERGFTFFRNFPRVAVSIG